MHKKTRGIILLWIIVSIAAIIAIIGVSIFFYYHTKNTYENQRQELIKQIADAKLKAKLESEKLNQLQDKFLGENPQNEIVLITFDKMLDVGNQTDSFFNNPNSGSPEFIPKTKTAAIKAKLDAQEVKIKEMINFWQKKAEVAKYQVLPTALVAEIKKDIEELNTFVQSLNNAVSALTPANSGLAQSQIDEYKEVISEAVQEVAKLQEDIVAFQGALPSPTPAPSNTSTDNSTQTNTNTNTNQTQAQTQTQTQTQNPNSTVTQEDIQNQQQAVEQANQQVEDLQNQLDNLPPPSTQNNDQGSPVVQVQTQNPPPVYDDGSGERPYTPPVVNYSGTPKLLQGTTQ